MEEITLTWWKGENGRNWGDALNPILVGNITNKEINYIEMWDDTDTFRYYAIGSILGSLCSTKSVVWTTGFISIDEKLNVTPQEICAVRGKLTRNLLLRQGFKCPEIYGDAALLYPRFYNPKIEKKYKIGIIPHYCDSDNPWLNQFENSNEILILNILEDINVVVDKILSCEKIISSSLHGLIASDSYNIPSLWVEFSDKVVGNGFKFYDYFSSVNRTDKEPIRINNDTKISLIEKSFHDYQIDIDLNLLYDSCPFK